MSDAPLPSALHTDSDAPDLFAASRAPVGPLYWLLPMLTLVRHEIWRFAKAPVITVLGPATAPVMLSLVLGQSGIGTGQTASDLITGIIFATSAMGAYGNTASALLFWKATRSLPGILGAPILPGTLIGSLIVAATVRCLAIGVLAFTACALAVRLPIVNPCWLAMTLAAIGIVYGGVGCVAGIFCRDNAASNSLASAVLSPFNTIVVIAAISCRHGGSTLAFMRLSFLCNAWMSLVRSPGTLIGALTALAIIAVSFPVLVLRAGALLD